LEVEQEQLLAATGDENQIQTLAAVDLGSNSFHMIVANEQDGVPRILDRLRDRVGLAEGVTADRKLDPEVGERVIECLERFGQRLRGIPSERVRAVGTATFRRMRRARRFLRQAEAALGHEIEVLTGKEEARLIYLGVAHSLAADAGRRLVIDIGGASTECIVGQRFETSLKDSLSMGCVTWTRRFFSKGTITKKRLERAELAAEQELVTIQSSYREVGWDDCIGASGTILAVADILERSNWAKGEITSSGLSKLSKAIVQAGHYEQLAFDGLRSDRRPVFAAGVSILRALFSVFGIERMRVSNGALREGLLYDLVGRIHDEDVRELSVAAFARRYAADEKQAERVVTTARAMFDQVAATWQLTPAHANVLAWAGRLHEVGLAVSYSGHHKHGSYLVANSDLSGFSIEEQDVLARLVAGHRRKIRSEVLDGLDDRDHRIVTRLLVLLRLAVSLHRSRGLLLPPVPTLGLSGSVLRLVFPPAWIAAHPLTRADLEAESALISALGVRLEVL